MVGLGNPEARYARTRHNAGQLVVERLAERLGVRRFAAKYAGRYAEAAGPGGRLGLLIPTTYMNRSGDAVSPAAGALRAARPQVLVVHDDLDLPFGTVRGKPGGGAGGHNGLRSVVEGLGGADFARIRLGIGRPPADFRGDEADWVLMAFTEPDDQVEQLLGRGLEMTETAVRDGIDAAIATFHAGEPGSRARARKLRQEDAAESQEGDGEADPAADPEERP